MPLVFKVRRNGLPWYILYTCPTNVTRVQSATWPTDFCRLRRRSNLFSLICLFAFLAWTDIWCSALLQFSYLQFRIMICWLWGALPGTFFVRRSHLSSEEQKKRVQSATQWYILYTCPNLMQLVFKVLRNGQPRYILYTCPNLMQLVFKVLRNGLPRCILYTCPTNVTRVQNGTCPNLIFWFCAPPKFKGNFRVLWTRITSGWGMCKVCTEAVYSVALEHELH